MRAWVQLEKPGDRFTGSAGALARICDQSVGYIFGGRAEIGEGAPLAVMRARAPALPVIASL
jgi:hypothetical protein